MIAIALSGVFRVNKNESEEISNLFFIRQPSLKDHLKFKKELTSSALPYSNIVVASVVGVAASDLTTFFTGMSLAIAKASWIAWV